jgi:orotidine-5'-phosphate decarboxylase
MTFSSKLLRAQALTSSVVCVGLDPDPNRLPDEFSGQPLNDSIRRFCTSIVEATNDYACAYKPNLAFFEALGREGSAVLADVIAAIPDDRVIIADGKRGDIGNTANRYAAAVFDSLSVDACTVSPYMGREAITPFLSRSHNAAFALVRTSNAGADELQTLDVGGMPLYLKVAEMLVAWASEAPGEIGFVVGATDVEALEQIRRRYPDIPVLIPGIGAQGGNPDEVMSAARIGRGPVVVNSSRSILYASSESDYADRACDSARLLRDALS